MWYAKARYYDSDLGRFVAEDPLKGNIADIQSQNLYPYVRNNPLKYVDLDGMRPEVANGSDEVNKPDYLGDGLKGIKNVISDLVTPPEGYKVANTLNPDGSYRIVPIERNSKWQLPDLGTLAKGSLQTLGGFGQMSLGYAISFGSTITGVAAIPGWMLGTYSISHGSSNFLEGGLTIVNSFRKKENRSDASKVNYVKNIYGNKKIYGVVDTTINVLSIGKGISDISKGLNTSGISKVLPATSKETKKIKTVVTSIDKGKKSVSIIDKIMKKGSTVKDVIKKTPNKTKFDTVSTGIGLNDLSKKGRKGLKKYFHTNIKKDISKYNPYKSNNSYRKVRYGY